MDFKKIILFSLLTFITSLNIYSQTKRLHNIEKKLDGGWLYVNAKNEVTTDGNKITFSISDTLKGYESYPLLLAEGGFGYHYENTSFKVFKKGFKKFIEIRGFRVYAEGFDENYKVSKHPINRKLRILKISKSYLKCEDENGLILKFIREEIYNIEYNKKRLELLEKYKLEREKYLKKN